MSSNNNKTKELLSIIVNCYNEEETIEIFYNEIIKVIKKIPTNYELIFIDDCSKDKTLEIIKKLEKKDKNIKYLSMSRNFGKEQGIYAGYEKSSGDYIVSIDVDLQDPPDLLIEMYHKIKKEGYDCVATRSITRNGYSLLRKMFTATYYKILKKLSSLEMKEGIRDYRMVTRKVADAIISMKEYHRYSRYLFEYAGFKTYWIEFPNQERAAGTTKWSFKRLFSVAIDAFLSSSTKILYLPIIFGILLNIISAILLIIFIILACNNIFNNLLISVMIILFISSLILISIGINSIYIARIHTETLNRPIYIIRDTNLVNEEDYEES